MARKTIDRELRTAETALNNSLNDPTLRDGLAAYGYDAERLQEGLALVERLRSLRQAQTKEYGEQYTATQAVTDAREEAHVAYMKQVALTRAALRDQPGRAASLGLDERRALGLSEWMEQADAFYENALGTPEVLDALAQFNVTADDLAAVRAQVKAVAPIEDARETEQSEAQAATEARDAAHRELSVWMSVFRTVAGVAFADTPQELEKLKITA
jgi:hypothetical protein